MSMLVSAEAVPEPSRRALGGRGSGVRSTRTSARFDPLLPFDEWRALGARLGTYSNATSWWLGDWLAFGQSKYGRRYKDAVAATGLDYQTLRNYAAVARRFPPSRRRETLTLQHHAEVSALPDDDQDRWLELASAQGWSRNELRRRLRERDPSPARDGELRRALQVNADPGRLDRWRQAAEQSGTDLAAWAAAVLDNAASDVLAPPSSSAAQPDCAAGRQIVRLPSRAG